MSDDDEIDIDNMDFDLPPELVNAPAPAQSVMSPAVADNPFAGLMDEMTPKLKFMPAEMSEKELELSKRYFSTLSQLVLRLSCLY
jgi:hypothetical protein